MSFRAVLHVCPVFLAGRMTSWVFQGSRAIQCVAVHCREGVPFVALKLNASSAGGLLPLSALSRIARSFHHLH